MGNEKADIYPTLGCSELNRLGHGAHPLGVAGLDFEVIRGIEGQLLDLVGQSVSHHRFNNPVVYFGVHIRAVVNDVSCRREKAEQL